MFSYTPDSTIEFKTAAGITACDASDDETSDAEHRDLNCVMVERVVAVVVRIEESRSPRAELVCRADWIGLMVTAASAAVHAPSYLAQIRPQASFSPYDATTNRLFGL